MNNYLSKEIDYSNENYMKMNSLESQNNNVDDPSLKNNEFQILLSKSFEIEKSKEYACKDNHLASFKI